MASSSVLLKLHDQNRTIDDPPIHGVQIVNPNKPHTLGYDLTPTKMTTKQDALLG